MKEIFTQVPQSKIATDDGSNLRIGEEVKNPIRFNPRKIPAKRMTPVMKVIKKKYRFNTIILQGSLGYNTVGTICSFAKYMSLLV